MEIVKNFFKKHRTSLIVGFICLIFASTFVLLFSYSTSPLYGDFAGGYVSNLIGYSGDTAQFLTIGKAWSEGQIPYHDLFDHKGPIIFFVDMLGYLLGGKTIICIFQILSLAITLFFIYKICTLATPRKLYFIFAAIITLIFLTSNYIEGNCVQEYCLPLITASGYYICRFLLDKRRRQHNYRYGFLYGLCVGVCLMSQSATVIPVAAGILTIIIFLLKDKKFKNLGQNLLAGLIGILVIFLPFAIYFAANNAFGDFIFATFVFNFDYVGHTQSWLASLSLKQLAIFAVAYFGYLSLFPTIVLTFLRKKYRYMLFLIIALVTETFMFFTTSLYPHYAMVVIFQIPLFLNELYLINIKHRINLFILIISLIGIVSLSGKQLAGSFHDLTTKASAIRSPQPVGYEKIIEKHLDDMRATSVLVDGGNIMKDFYLKYNITPQDKYFVLQGWHANYNPQVRAEIEQEMRTTTSKYIITDGANWFKELFADRYELLGSENNFSLYRLKQ